MIYSLQVFQDQQQNIITTRKPDRLFQILSLYKQGLPQREISNRLNIHRTTIYREIQKFNNKQSIPITIYYSECIGCKKLFINQGKKVYNKFCSKECKNENKAYRYDKFNWCDNCRCWIPIINSVKIKNVATCPKTNCNHNKLKTRSRKSQFNHKRRQVKRIE